MPQHLERDVAMSDGAFLWTAGSNGGPDRPGLVLLHGGPGMWDYLGPVAAMADGRFRTYRYDQRGCGRSAPNDDHRMARHVADLDELRRHFGHDRWYLFGHSFGATLGLHYTAAHADHVAGLVYCSGVGIDWPTHRAEYRARQAERLGAAQTRRRDELEQRERTWHEEVEWRTLCWLPDFADSATAHAHARADAETPLPLNLHCNRALSAETSGWTRERELALCAHVTAQVWLVHGGEDPRPVAGVAALADALPTADLRVLPGVGHQPWRERPDLVRAVLDEVAEHAAGGSPRATG